MRNPNGYGSIFKLSGKRRKPFAVRVTVGFNDSGKQIRKIIGTFVNRREANEFLVAYNDNPLMYINQITFSQVYDKWSKGKYELVSKSTIANYRISFEHARRLHDICMLDIKTYHLQEVIDSVGDKYGAKKQIRNLFNQLYDYALRNDIVAKDYSKFVDIGKNKKVSNRKPFTNEEIELLWNNLELEWVDTVLILIYTGMRIGELLDVKNEDINLEEEYIVGGNKTEAGKNRLIPLNKKIIPLIKNRMSEHKYFILNYKNKQKGYSNYKRENFEKLMRTLNMEHTPHDTRHTFATLLNNANANPTNIIKLIGHTNFNTTEKVYTHKDIEELKKTINKI